MTTIRIKPRKGIVLAGIPAVGADVDAALAREWLAAGLVTAVKPAPARAATSAPTGPARRVATRGSDRR
jgi:hypothetical protein